MTPDYKATAAAAANRYQARPARRKRKGCGLLALLILAVLTTATRGKA